MPRHLRLAVDNTKPETAGPDHKVRVRLVWLRKGVAIEPGADRTGAAPYKWIGECVCGWRCMSWAFDRRLDAALDPAHVAEGNSPTGGALPMALEHVGLLNWDDMLTEAVRLYPELTDGQIDLPLG